MPRKKTEVKNTINTHVPIDPVKVREILNKKYTNHIEAADKAYLTYHQFKGYLDKGLLPVSSIPNLQMIFTPEELEKIIIHEPEEKDDRKKVTCEGSESINIETLIRKVVTETLNQLTDRKILPIPEESSRAMRRQDTERSVKRIENLTVRICNELGISYSEEERSVS